MRIYLIAITNTKGHQDSEAGGQDKGRRKV